MRKRPRPSTRVAPAGDHGVLGLGGRLDRQHAAAADQHGHVGEDALGVHGNDRDALDDEGGLFGGLGRRAVVLVAGDGGRDRQQ